MAEITQVISTIPTAGHRGVDTRDTFVTKQEAFQDHLTTATVTELNTYKNQVNAVASELNTNIDTIYAPIAAELPAVTAVGDDIASVVLVAGHITNIDLVGGSIANVNSVGGSIANVNTVAPDISKVNTVGTNIANVNAVGGSIANVNTIAPDISKVNTVSTNISSVNTVSTNIANVNTVAANNTKVTTVANSISSVNTVSTNIANVDTVATNITAIQSINSNMTDVQYFADIYQGTKTVIPSLRNDGSALQIGDMYFHNDLSSPSSSALYVYAVGGWSLAALNTNILYTKTQLDTVNVLRADKYLAAQSIANMLYTNGDLVKIRYKADTDVDYEVLTYSLGNLTSIQHYIGSVLKGTTTLSYSGGNLVSAIFVGA